MELNKAIEKLKKITNDQVIGYTYSDKGNLVLVTDSNGRIGFNHYLVINEDNILPVNPLICEMKNEMIKL